MFRYHQLNILPDFFKNYFVTNNQIHEHIISLTREMLQNFTNVIKGQIILIM